MVTSMIVVIVWITCGVINTGLSFAYDQGRWPNLAKDDHKADLIFAVATSLPFGPIALTCTLLQGRYGYGWRLK